MALRSILGGLSLAVLTAFLAAQVTRDNSVAFLAGAIVLAVGAFLLGSEPVVSRVPILQSPARRLAPCVRAGDALRMALLGIRTSTAAEPDAEATWWAQVVAWRDETRNVLATVAPDYVATFDSEIDLKVGARYAIVPEWASNQASYMDRRLARLAEIVLRL